MINEDHELNRNHREPATDGRARNADSEIGELFGSSIGRMVLQYQAVLRQGLDKEIEKIVVDFQKASVGSNEIVAKQMRSRIEELVSEEVRRVFDNTLHRAERTFTDPVRALAADLGSSDTLRNEVSERSHRQSRRARRNPRAGMSERHDEQPNAGAEDVAHSGISPSVPTG